MSQSRTCPKCEGGMVKGFVPDHRKHGYDLMAWHSGHPVGDSYLNLKMRDGPGIPIGAYRCSGCGFLEFYSEERHTPVASRETAEAPEEVRERHIRETNAANEKRRAEDNSISMMVFVGVLGALFGLFASGFRWTGAVIGAVAGGIFGYRTGLPEKKTEKEDQKPSD